MTAIASLLSTTAVPLPGAPAPIGVTTLAPFPDLGPGQAVNAAVVPAASGRQAIAGSGNALPVATGDVDALAWLDPMLADVGDGAEQVAREGVAGSSPAAANSSPASSLPVTIVGAGTTPARAMIGNRSEPSSDMTTDVTALPLAAFPIQTASTLTTTSALEEHRFGFDTPVDDAVLQTADDDAPVAAQQPDSGQRGGMMPQPAIAPATMPIAPLSAQVTTAATELLHVPPSAPAGPQPGRAAVARPATSADIAASLALSAAPTTAHPAVLHGVPTEEAAVASPADTGSQRAANARENAVPTAGAMASAPPVAGSGPSGPTLAHAVAPLSGHAAPETLRVAGAPVRPVSNDAPIDVARGAIAPAPREAEVHPLTIGVTPATDAHLDAEVALPQAGRAASPRATLTPMPLQFRGPADASRAENKPAAPVPVDAAVSATRSGVGPSPLNMTPSASATAALAEPVARELPRVRGVRPTERHQSGVPASSQTFVAGADARVPLNAGVPLPLAMPAGTATSVSAPEQAFRLSPTQLRVPATQAMTTTAVAAARGAVTSGTGIRDAVSPRPNLATGSSMPTGGLSAPTFASVSPTGDVAVSFAPAVPAPSAVPASASVTIPSTSIAPAADEQPGPRAGIGPGATAREAASIASPPRIALELPATTLRATSAPAAQVFAAAIHRALGEQDMRQPGDAMPAPAPLAAAIPGIAAAGAVQQGALDMRHEHWPAAMIERIVTLRDMAAENDTRLRLSPDMLGTIDVSLKRDGDQVQVQITAEQAQTRQLLADAQPRLAELADARGVKLQLSGGHAGGAGQQPGPGNSSGGDATRQQAPATPFSTSPRSAEHGATDDTDQRIA